MIFTTKKLRASYYKVSPSYVDYKLDYKIANLPEPN